MKRKSTVIFLIILVIITAAGFAVMYVNHISGLNQQAALQREIKTINRIVTSDYLGEAERDELYEHLNSCVTSGKYAIVEQAAKKYYIRYFDDMFKTIDELNENLNNRKIFSIENLITDDDNLSKSKAYIIKIRKIAEDGKVVYLNNLSDEVIDSYIQDAELTPAYLELYYAITEAEPDESNDTFLKLTNRLIKQCNATESVIYFLADNKNDWELEDDKIVFQTPAVAEEYGRLYQECMKYN